MNHRGGSPGARLGRSQVTRRAFLGITAGAVGGLAVPAPAPGAGASSTGAGGSGVSWINQHAIPLTGTDPQQAAGELRHLRGVVRGAAIVGLGESAHGTHIYDVPPPVRRWLEGAARMRIIGSAYFPANDANYAIAVDSWRGAFDAILHLDRVTPSRLLAAGQGLR